MIKESTKSRLTTFARLWVIPTILFIAMCVTAAIGVMKDRTVLMGISVIGTIVMFVILLCQLVAAIIVRRWWCMAGIILAILLSVGVWLCTIVALAAGQYRPPVREPEITGIVTAVTGQEDPGELFSTISRAWESYQKGEDYMGEFTVDSDNNFVLYANGGISGVFEWADSTEFRCWKCLDNRHSMVAVAHRDYTDGVPVCGQYAGLTLYLYDTDSQSLEWARKSDCGIEQPEINAPINYFLDCDGCDIFLTAFSGQEERYAMSYVWDGDRFQAVR